MEAGQDPPPIWPSTKAAAATLQQRLHPAALGVHGRAHPGPRRRERTTLQASRPGKRSSPSRPRDVARGRPVEPAGGMAIALLVSRPHLPRRPRRTCSLPSPELARPEPILEKSMKNILCTALLMTSGVLACAARSAESPCARSRSTTITSSRCASSSTARARWRAAAAQEAWFTETETPMACSARCSTWRALAKSSLARSERRSILLTGGAGAIVPRVLDFGIAKTVSEPGAPSGNTLTREPSAFTPAYAAPEQVTSSRTGPWTDVHGLALLLVELILVEPGYGTENLLEAAVSPERPTARAWAHRRVAGARAHASARAQGRREAPRRRAAALEHR
jgi:hypothetical protein